MTTKQAIDLLSRIVADYSRSDEDARGVSQMEYLIEQARALLAEDTWQYPYFECDTCGRLTEAQVEYREVDKIGWFYCLACNQPTTKIANASDEHDYALDQEPRPSNDAEDRYNRGGW